MKKISAYQATDGTIFNDKKECAKHQAQLNVVNGLKEIGNRIVCNAEFHNDDLDLSLIASGEAFAHFVSAHAEDIKLALAGKPLTKQE